ncbi:PE family protein, partial [Mycobacterium asiaticum]|uniref:PE family protein n=1 Tax=Mycobacterium asiaticum TaxID=1790 RepID=UPI000AEE225A
MQVATESLITAARDLAAIGSDLNSAQLQAAAPTTNIASAGIDEISTAVAGLFGSHAQEFQAVAGRAAAFHDQFIQKLTGGANAYASAEAENLAVLSAGGAPPAPPPPPRVFGGGGGGGVDAGHFRRRVGVGAAARRPP